MLVPLSWLRAIMPAASGLSGREVGAALLRVGMEVERVETLGIDQLVVGRVLSAEPEPQKNGKTIHWCSVDVGAGEPHGIVCGASNFGAGDLVVVALPGAVLPGGFAIAARKTYGHVSDGMICSARELGLGDDHTGILVLGSGAAGDDANALLGLDDEVLDIAITPDRGYALSMRGIARELAASLGLVFDDPGLGSSPDLPAGQAVSLDDTSGCDRYVALTVAGLDPAAASPAWMRQRLSKAGMRPISLAVDVTNHVMLELGQPLHAFDASSLTGAVRVRRAVDGEQLTTLDGAVRTLDAEDLVIADDSGAIALAGVMGGASTEISSTTWTVLIEAAHFAPRTVARTARRHRLPSEAARRFERAVDPALCRVAAVGAARLLVEHGGAELVSLTDVDRAVPLPVIAFDPSLPSGLGGREVPVDDVWARLESVGCAGSVTAVQPPSWRPDLAEPVDLVEEVLRLEGLAELPSILPIPPAGGGLTASQRRMRAASRALAAAGYVEVRTSPFAPPGAAHDDEPEVFVRNPLSAEESVLRTSLLPGLAAAVRRNVSRGRADVALYETGSVFRDRRGPDVVPPPPGLRPEAAVLQALQASLPEQPLHAGWLIVGHAEPAGWWGAGRAADWTDAVAAAVTVARDLGVTLDVTAGERAPWHPGRCAVLSLSGVEVGRAGELHPEAVEAFGLPAGACAGELDLDPLLALDPGPVTAPSPSSYPAGSVDVALVVAADVPQSLVLQALRAGAGPLVESVELFDVYVGAGIPDAHRSLAYALRFRADDRTLSGEEVNGFRDAAVTSAAAATGAVLRA